MEMVMMMSHAALPPIQIWPVSDIMDRLYCRELTATETRSMGIVSDVLL